MIYKNSCSCRNVPSYLGRRCGKLLFMEMMGRVEKYTLRRKKGVNQIAAEGYVGLAGKSGSFSSIEGFSLRLGSNDFAYHNSIAAAKSTTWSTPTSFASSGDAFNSLALGYKGTRNFAQMKFTLKNYGLFVKGKAAQQGITSGGGTQLLQTPISLKTSLKQVPF